MTLIIRDGKALAKAVNAFAKKHSGYTRASQDLAWEVVAHTAKYGDCSVLKKFYAGLDASWAKAFAYWLGEMIMHPDYAMIDPETEKAVRWINLRDGEFTVRKGAEAARHHWLKQVSEDENRIGFLSMSKKESDNASTFDNLKLVEELKKLVKRCDRDTSNVSKRIVEVLAEAEAKIERIISTAGAKVITTSVEEDEDEDAVTAALDRYDADLLREANLIAA